MSRRVAIRVKHCEVLERLTTNLRHAAIPTKSPGVGTTCYCLGHSERKIAARSCIDENQGVMPRFVVIKVKV
jgi:hypothetical protein